MQKQWTESNVTFLDHIGSKFGQSAKASLEAVKMVVADVYETMLPIFDIEE